jgi:hypothetical protein
MMGYGISIFIIAWNAILRKYIIELIKWIGEDTHSQQLSSMTNMVLVA